ncbi:PepSY domain-containing protein [Metasolibacillus sp.]|uniref:PepSY-associated TM helix domain-containing protein n=1 Tax=Metasolibacillus sp. TaxID=2703680 RepID=UPI0025F518D0|nr:PepSY domain-containing protein [Metasolibacillus sp.]MCT6925436.1 PepSY domain-containing protein [Metasolibacillus sp.]MCT6941537.1 PepSY domain-containing protein [Metasolibacillus sp.]
MKNFYNRFWRWHFFAALFITPLLLTLTISGIGYLFYPEVENKLYADSFFGDSDQKTKLTIDEGVEQAKEAFNDYSLSKIIILDEPYNTRLTMTNSAGEQKYVFLDDNYQIVGSQDANYTFSNVLRNLHSSLFIGGTFVNYLVELAACWAIFLLLSGLYMTVRKKLWKKAQTETTRIRSRRWHALLGVMITIPMVAIIFTGLPWSALMGHFIYTAAQENPSIGIPELQQNPPTSEVNEIPWITRKNETPTSNAQDHSGHGGHTGAADYSNEYALSVEELIGHIENENIPKPYSIILPSSEEGVFTVAKGSGTGVTGLDVSPDEEITIYFDQYSGTFISSVGYDEYGILGKWFTWGIPLHEGHLFGWANKIINLFVCLAFLYLIYLGFKTWLLRRQKGMISAPPIAKEISIPFYIFVVVLGIIMPLFGISLILVVFIELVLYFTKRQQTTLKES